MNECDILSATIWQLVRSPKYQPNTRRECDPMRNKIRRRIRHRAKDVTRSHSKRQRTMQQTLRWTPLPAAAAAAEGLLHHRRDGLPTAPARHRGYPGRYHQLAQAPGERTKRKKKAETERKKRRRRAGRIRGERGRVEEGRARLSRWGRRGPKRGAHAQK